MKEQETLISTRNLKKNSPAISEVKQEDTCSLWWEEYVVKVCFKNAEWKTEGVMTKVLRMKSVLLRKNASNVRVLSASHTVTAKF